MKAVLLALLLAASPPPQAVFRVRVLSLAKAEDLERWLKGGYFSRLTIAHRGTVRPGQKTFLPIVAEKVPQGATLIADVQIMASDGHCNGQPAFQGFSLTLTAKNDADAARYFDTLSNGGKIDMPLAKTFFSSSFGMLTDRFGVGWMVIADHG